AAKTAAAKAAAGSKEAAAASAADATKAGAAAGAAAQSGAKKLAEAAEKEKAVAAAETAAAEAKDKKRKPGSAPAVELTLALALPPATQGAAEAAAGAKPGHGAVEKKGEAARKEPHLTVSDLRHSAQGRAEAAQGGSDASSVQAIAPQGPARDLHPQHASDQGDLTRDLSLGAGNGSPDASRGRVDPALAPPRGADFQSLLAQKLHDGWNGEIVKNAHIVLKDGDSGMIRLRLKPESLGDVKIELNLSDKNISGRIVVQSDEAKHAFERNLNDLADAFRQGGFESAKLEVSVGSGSQQGNQGAAGGDTGAPFYSERLRGAVAPTAPSQAGAWSSARRGAVDILA
ncbi:MAG: flagellar hook-length control protein FliK, partial [Treponema sp.]|nr:flagellar hook-length control protein FliK [Treponema sp.]